MNIEEPIEVGWYAYSGGTQMIVFHLRETGQWSAHFASGYGSDCGWQYIEQALGVWDLVKITPPTEDRFGAVEALHRPMTWREAQGRLDFVPSTGYPCIECRQALPCATLRAIGRD